MKLYMFPIAPNPTKVRLYLAEKRARGASIEIEEVMVSLPENEQNSPEHLARSPFGTVPVLETLGGHFLFESRVIIDYLEELHPESPMFGRDPESRALARQIERICDVSLLGPIAQTVHATNSPIGRSANPTIAAHYSERVPARLDYLEGLLADGRPHLAGDELTVADCTLAAALQFARFRELDFIGKHPRIQSWDAAFRARETAASVLSL